MKTVAVVVQILDFVSICILSTLYVRVYFNAQNIYCHRSFQTVLKFL
jgi:hypothetical protein